MEMVDDVLKQHQSTGVAPKSAGRLPVEEFMKYVEETRNQPAFRSSMDTAGDYYDGNQMTAEILQGLNAMGFGSLMTNLIKPSIDTVLGLEAKNRSDFRCVSDDDQHQDVAEAMSAKLAEAERESHADRACSDAYASQVKTGLGWVHVTRNSDPFLYPYKAESIHRREMFWDWSAREMDLSDARYVIRQKWYPTDMVKAAMPQHGDLIDASASGWQPDWMQRARESTTLMNAFEQESRMSLSAWEWRNIDNRRIALQECWYATYIRGLVLRLPTGKTAEFDKRNPMHMAVVQAGIARPEPAVYRKLRCSIWFGPHLLQDYDSGKNKMPYVPFWGFREDLTGVPYGLVRSMIPLQDEVNARRRKLMWLLSSKRVQIDSDALDARFNSFSDLVDEISRPDSLTILNPGRKNLQSAMVVESDLALSHQQFEILQEAKEGIQAAAGIFNSIMGKTDGAKSGVAVNALVEQSSNTLGEINDNFKNSRQVVGERLVDMIRQDLSGKQVQVMTGMGTSRTKKIVLNAPKIDEITGMQYLENNTDLADFKVALEEVPSTPAYRAQQLMTIGETLKALPPELQAPMMPFYIEATDLPKRAEMAKLLRKALGQQDGDEPQDPMVAQLQQQLQVVHQQSEEAMEKYEQAVQDAQQKAQALTAQNQMLQVQNANKSADYELKAKELEMKTAQSQSDAQAAAVAAQAKTQEIAFQTQQMQLKQTELALAASKASADHAAKLQDLQLRSNDQEHSQLLAVHQHDLAKQKQEAELEPEEQEPDVKGIVDQAVQPLNDKLEKVLADLKQAAREDKLEEAAEKRGRQQAEKEAKAAAKEDSKEDAGEDPNAAAESKRADEMHKVKLEQEKAKTDAIRSGAKVKETAAKASAGAAKGQAPAPAPAPAPAGSTAPVAAKKRQVVFTRDKAGKLSGVSINGKPAALVLRGPDGKMTGAELVPTDDEGTT